MSCSSPAQPVTVNKGSLKRPHPQKKLERVIRGDVFDVGVDPRGDSKTYGEYYLKTTYTFRQDSHTDFWCFQMRRNSHTSTLNSTRRG